MKQKRTISSSAVVGGLLASATRELPWLARLLFMAYKDKSKKREYQKQWVSKMSPEKREAYRIRKNIARRVLVRKERSKQPHDPVLDRLKMARRHAVYRWRNRSRLIARKRERYYANHSNNITAMRLYREKNPDIIKAASKRWHQKNSARSVASARRWQRNNPEKWKKIQARAHLNYEARHPGTALAIQHLRRARRMSATVNPKQTKEFILKVRSMRRIRCYYCDGMVPGKKAHIDHVVPLAKGGAHEVGNLCASCPSCNLTKSAKTLSEWRRLEQPVML